MSTLKVSSINNPSASAGGISIDSSGAISGALPYPNRNLLYNGAMQVAQRGTSATGITTSGYYTADRWYCLGNSFGTWTQSVESDAPLGSGFSKSLKMLCTTSDAAPSASDRLVVNQSLEGQDLQRVRKGTASALQLTVSFWVKSNVTGAYIIELFDTDNTRQVSASYSVSASATWEKKIVTFPLDSTGPFDNDNLGSLTVQFWLVSGSDWTSGTLNTSWASSVNANRAVGQTNLAAATNNYWQVTGVQLEVGDTATEFEHLPFGVELVRCQRYYQKSYRYTDVPGTTNSNGAHVGVMWTSWLPYHQTVYLSSTMRSNPVVTVYSPNNGATGQAAQFNSGGVFQANTPFTAGSTSNSSFNVGSSNGTANTSNYFSVQWTASAEL